jgi:hypothetical protein
VQHLLRVRCDTGGVAIPTGYLFPDVSGYVKVTDWPAFARAHPVAACKVSEGATWPSRREDDYWSEFQANCRRHGILPVGYHFLTRAANLNEQVANYLRRLDGGPVGIALDVESNPGQPAPSVQQAHDWLDAVSQRTGRPRSQMLTYMPRWWWEEHDARSTLLADTLCWMSDYRPNRDLSPYAGWSGPVVLQFSSTAPGAGMPPGDMNVAVGMTAAQLAARLGLASNDSLEDDVSQADVEAALKKRYTPGEETPLEALQNCNNRYGGLIEKLDFFINAMGERLDALDTAVAEIKARL